MGGAYIAKLQFCVMENMLEKSAGLQGSTLVYSYCQSVLMLCIVSVMGIKLATKVIVNSSLHLAGSYSS